MTVLKCLYLILLQWQVGTQELSLRGKHSTYLRAGTPVFLNHDNIPHPFNQLDLHLSLDSGKHTLDFSPGPLLVLAVLLVMFLREVPFCSWSYYVKSSCVSGA